MAHIEQQEFCKKIKEKYPEYFKNCFVLDCGSLDINGSNRDLFENCEYLGIDIGEGKNVDVVSKIHEFKASDKEYDFIISTECFEHDMYYDKSIRNIIRMLKNGGAFLFTCASTNRPEHGTLRCESNSSPLTSSISEWSDYYKNLTEEDIRKVMDLDSIFSTYEISVERDGQDLNFFGIKK